jgi:hypothetical protein
MKIHRYIIILVVSVIVLSCESDLLNTTPKDRLASDLFWNTEQDAVYAATGVYSILGDHWRYASMDGYTDIAHFILQWREESVVEKHTFNSSNNVIASEWSYYYTIINASNTFLENVLLIEEMDESLRERLIAEIRTLRSFAYINLVMLYGDVPLITTTLTVQDAKSVNRTSKSQIWDFISDELAEAAQALPTIQEEKGRITKGVALGLKARAMLYADRYEDARNAAKSVMDLGVYQLNDSYAQIFKYSGENSSEIMFARQYAKDISSHSIFAFFTPNSLFTQQCQVVPTKPLIDSYTMQSTGLPITNPSSGFDINDPYTDRDPRLYHTIYITGDKLPNGQTLNTTPGSGTGDDVTISAENVTPTGWYFKKYMNDEDYSNPWNCGINLIYLRYAEVLLTYAEACIELGGSAINQTVLDALNAIRTRDDVNMPMITTTNQSELREIVRNERLVELAMEGHRLYDIRRWKIGEVVIPGTVKGMTYEDPANTGSYITLELTGYVKEFDPQKHYLWPIPFRELDLNENIEQNPGY